MNNIKIRINHNQDSRCSICDAEWKNTAEMYDMKIGGKEPFTLCRMCMSEIFNATLKAECMYNGRVKSQDDIKRSNNEKQAKYGTIGSKPSEVLKGESDV